MQVFHYTTSDVILKKENLREGLSKASSKMKENFNPFTYVIQQFWNYLKLLYIRLKNFTF